MAQPSLLWQYHEALGRLHWRPQPGRFGAVLTDSHQSATGVPLRLESSASGSVAEWSIAPVLKTGDPQGSVSSNLTASARLNDEQWHS